MNSNPTCTREVIVKLENGLHIRPVSQIVKVAQKFSCELAIRKGDRTVDGKSILDLMSLAAEQGASLLLEGRGDDAAQAVEAIAALFERDFASDRPE
ncbi:MAG: HPr family phosphocarrier protein [Planctomycetia bacterium]|nr:HPr family phosphocarrier protein [Planctomycetia bacterium]